MGNYEKALQFVLEREGGFCNVPADHGGATNKGITQTVYNQYRRDKGETLQSVEYITDQEVSDIYSTKYWLPAHCDALIDALSVIHFDSSVNNGVGQASKFLQRCLGVQDDGIIGPATLAKLATTNQALLEPIYILQRQKFYELIVQEKPDQEQFLKGWLNRLEELKKYIAV